MTHVLTGIDISEVWNYRYNVMNCGGRGGGVVIPGASISTIPWAYRRVDRWSYDGDGCGE